MTESGKTPEAPGKEPEIEYYDEEDCAPLTVAGVTGMQTGVQQDPAEKAQSDPVQPGEPLYNPLPVPEAAAPADPAVYVFPKEIPEDDDFDIEPDKDDDFDHE